MSIVFSLLSLVILFTLILIAPWIFISIGVKGNYHINDISGIYTNAHGAWCIGWYGSDYNLVVICQQNPVSQAKGSPPNSSSGRSVALPAAASWGMRASNCRPLASNSVSSNGPAKQKSDSFNGSVLPSLVASTSHTSVLPSDVGKISTVNGENHVMQSSKRSESWDMSKQHGVRDWQKRVADTTVPSTVVQDVEPTLVTLSDHLSRVSLSKDKDGGVMIQPNVVNSEDLCRQSCSSVPDKDDINTSGNVQDLCSGLSATVVDSCPGFDHFESVRATSHPAVRSPGSLGLQQNHSEKPREPLTLLPSRKTSTLSDGLCAFKEPTDWRSESQIHVLQNSCHEAEEDLLALEGRTVKASEVVISQVSNLPHLPNHSSGHYLWQNGDPCSASNLGNIGPRAVHRRVDEAYVPFNSGDLSSNGHCENKISSSTELDGFSESSNLFSSIEKGKCLARFSDDVGNAEKNAASEMGESSIISNILSMDFDVWGDSLTSPQNFAKLLNEANRQHGSQKIESSWKVQNNNQSRFSFARQDEFRNEGSDFESPFSSIPKKYSMFQGALENRDHFMEKLRNGFSSSSIEETDPYSSSHLVTSSNKLSGECQLCLVLFLCIQLLL
uniref:Uncharacterized protein n=1 Tax=Nelumbo nucifera TaxID=4432 RepID=A0A822Y771_NELNU|nr:TPA_asm: hypothetical protein HUJ06_029371 [Nelumbo nucifera]